MLTSPVPAVTAEELARLLKQDDGERVVLEAVRKLGLSPHNLGQDDCDEILRLLDSVQLTAKEQVATPVNWKQGEDVVIVPAVSDEEAKKKYPDGWKTPLPYIRLVAQP